MPWCRARLTECAAAWVFATAAIRFCEENALVGQVWLVGACGDVTLARAAQAEYFRTHPPTHTDREYLGKAIAHFTRMPATRALFGRTSAIRLLSPSVTGAHALVEFWREAGADGGLLRDMTDIGSDAGVLAELYAAAGLTPPTADPQPGLGVISVAVMLRDFAATVQRLRGAGLATLDVLDSAE